jgi:alpha-beta hydrolase superfamily lysophospholipase
LYYDIVRKNELLGLVSTSPWLKLVGEMPGFVVGLIRFLYWIIPGLIISSGIDPKKISRDESEVEKYKTDPLIHDKTSFRVFIQFTDAASYIMKNSRKLSLPVLLMHGSDDLITDPQASQELYNGNKEAIDFKLWDGLHHETHNEPEKDEVITFLIQWLDNLYSSKNQK